MAAQPFLLSSRHLPSLVDPSYRHLLSPGWPARGSQPLPQVSAVMWTTPQGGLWEEGAPSPPAQAQVTHSLFHFAGGRRHHRQHAARASCMHREVPIHLPLPVIQAWPLQLLPNAASPPPTTEAHEASLLIFETFASLSISMSQAPCMDLLSLLFERSEKSSMSPGAFPGPSLCLGPSPQVLLRPVPGTCPCALGLQASSLECSILASGHQQFPLACRLPSQCFPGESPELYPMP